jgi:undecaprenyl-diphosphatase
MISYLQAAVLGLLQGVTELFPISSLGHSVLVPALIGGSWKDLVTQSSTTNSEASPYLAFIVALHVGTAIALLIFFRSDWVRIISAWFRSLGPSFKARRIVARDSDERLAWLLVIGTIPVGITGLLLEHTFRTLFAKPLAAAVFLTINGLILLAGEALRRRAPVDEDDNDPGATPALGNDSREVRLDASGTGVATQRRTRRLVTLSYREGFFIGLFQTAALLAGISRSGVSMVGGLARGLSHRDAARFSFLLATPVILAAGVLKLPTLTGSSASHIHGQVIVGAVLAGVAAFVSVKWLTKYFETRTLIPFAIYSLVAGIFCIIWFA